MKKLDYRIFGEQVFRVGLPLSFGAAHFFVSGAPDSAQRALNLMTYWPMKCPWHLLTGHRCPTCGLGRSLVLAWTGNFEKAWSYHPAGIFFLGLVLALWIGLSFFRAREIWSTATRQQKWLARSWPIFIALYFLWGLMRKFPAGT